MTQENLPFFSVIVPTFNRPRQLATCLQALAELDYPRDRVEVIIVDDGSPEAPSELIAEVSPQISVTLLQQANAGPAKARNAGVAASKGTLLAFTDDDCAPDSHWLLTLAESFLKASNEQNISLLVGGRTINSLLQDSYAAASQTLIDYLYTYYNTQPGGPRFFASNNIALSRDGFDAIGGFDTDFRTSAGEDRDFCDRWLQQGFLMASAPDAVIQHAHAMTAKKFWAQHFRYGQAAFQFHQRRKQQPLKVEPLSFYGNLLWAPFSKEAPYQNRRRALEASGLLFLSQAANALGFASEKVRRR